jgi:hypothetical protein
MTSTVSANDRLKRDIIRRSQSEQPEGLANGSTGRVWFDARTHSLVENGNLLGQLPPGDKHRAHNHCHSGRSVSIYPTRQSNRRPRTGPGRRPNVLSTSRMWFGILVVILTRYVRTSRDARSRCALKDFACAARCKAVRIMCAPPSVSRGSVLMICSLRAAAR